MTLHESHTSGLYVIESNVFLIVPTEETQSLYNGAALESGNSRHKVGNMKMPRLDARKNSSTIPTAGSAAPETPPGSTLVRGPQLRTWATGKIQASWTHSCILPGGGAQPPTSFTPVSVVGEAPHSCRRDSPPKTRFWKLHKGGLHCLFLSYPILLLPKYIRHIRGGCSLQTAPEGILMVFLCLLWGLLSFWTG